MAEPKLLILALKASASVWILTNSWLARLTALTVTAISRKLTVTTLIEHYGQKNLVVGNFEITTKRLSS